MNRRIRVLFVVNSLHFGGAEKHVVTLLNHLDIERFSLSLAYLKDEAALLPQLEKAQLNAGAFCCHVSAKVDLRAVRMLSDHIRHHAVEVLLCTNSYSLLYGWLARRMSGCRPKLVVAFHSTELGTFKDKLQMLFYRPFFRACDLLIYVCESQRAYWRKKKLRAKRDAVIYNGIDLEDFIDRFTNDEKALTRQRFGLAADDYVVGLCAAMRPEKAHGDLLEAIARLKAGGTPAKALLIGDGPERENIERRIAALDLIDEVSITGFMGDVRPAIASCDVMALVSHHVETFSISALEGMALGKPTVMTEIGGAREQILHGECGFLFPRGDVEALEDVLRQLAEPAIRNRMGREARRRVERCFSLERMVSAYEKHLVELAITPPGI